MDNKNSQIIRMDEHTLYFDCRSNVLLCKSIESGKKLWIKKIDDPGFLNGVIEDSSRFFIAFESGEKNGIFLTVNKNDGSTLWDIPGRAFLYRIFQDFIYLIFIDESENYFFIKVDILKGTIVWHHKVERDLCEYTINPSGIVLQYLSGKIEKIDIETGSMI